MGVSEVCAISDVYAVFFIHDKIVRFHQEVKDTLERKRADVIELAQNLTDNMDDIHGGLIQCMTLTLAELRRSKVEVG